MVRDLYALDPGVFAVRSTISKNTVLHCAAQRGRSDIVEYLVTLPETEVDGTCIHGRTALHYAAAAVQNNAKSISALLAHGADATLVDDDGTLPIHATHHGLCPFEMPSFCDNGLPWLSAKPRPPPETSQLPTQNRSA